jgi:endothelin-converting enzyme/putative endopeptidase
MAVLGLAVVLGMGQRGLTQSLHSIDMNDLDRKASPCDDFFQFSNGTWRANNPIPASMTRWSRRWQAGENAKDRLHEILEAAAAEKGAAKGSTEQIIGDYYGACMDETRANVQGMDPVKPWFAKIDAARDITALQGVIAEMHGILVPVPFCHCRNAPQGLKPGFFLESDRNAEALRHPNRVD